MSKLKASFKMPKRVKITGRTSTITNSFVSSIIPVIAPSDEAIASALSLLEMTPGNVDCAYCGDKSTEWDHLNPLVKDKKPTGYISEIENLVPCCGKCNQSKGNKQWRTWIVSEAKLSPKTKGIPDLDRRIDLLTKYEDRNRATRYDFEEIVDSSKWQEYWEEWENLLRQMKEAQVIADKIQESIRRATK